MDTSVCAADVAQIACTASARVGKRICVFFNIFIGRRPSIIVLIIMIYGWRWPMRAGQAAQICNAGEQLCVTKQYYGNKQQQRHKHQCQTVA